MNRFRRIGIMLFILGISSFLCAQAPEIILEKAIYAEETLGSLNDAIMLYQQVATAVNATRRTYALALFRLGLCYQKSRSAKDAQAAFAKLSKLYPEQHDLIAQIPASASNRLEFKPAPWVDGEVLRMSIKVQNSRQAGYLLYKFESADNSGKMAWKVQLIQSRGLQYTSALIDAASFIPIVSLVKEGLTGREFQSCYGSQQIEYVMIGNASKKIAFPLRRTTYDNQQIVQILRCLPLQKGFQITIPIFSSNSSEALVDAKIAVVEKERITVPAGTFDCYKTILTRGNQSPSSTYWISDDAHSYIVKANENEYLGGTMPVLVNLELLSISVAEKKQPVHFKNDILGIALEAPAGWLVDDFDLSSTKAFGSVDLTGPEGEVSGLLTYIDISESNYGNIYRDEEQIISSIKNSYQQSSVRPESRVATTISDAAAIRYIVDYKSRGKDRVQYIFHFSTASKRCQLRFETAKEIFEKLQPALDSIVSSLRVQ